LYADRVTNSMKNAIAESNRRQWIQNRYNKQNNITPASIKKNITNILESIYESDYLTISKDEEDEFYNIPPDKIPKEIETLFREMKKSSVKHEYEKAADIKKKIKKLKEMEIKYLLS